MLEPELTCEACGQAFAYPEAERATDEQFGYPPPRLCPDCTQERRSAKAAERAAKRPRRRRFRR